MYPWDFLLWQVFRDYVQCWWERRMRMLPYFTFCCVRPWCLYTSVFLWPLLRPTTAACCTNSSPTDSSSRCGGLCLGEDPKLSSKCPSLQYPSVSIIFYITVSNSSSQENEDYSWDNFCWQLSWYRNYIQWNIRPPFYYCPARPRCQRTNLRLG